MATNIQFTGLPTVTTAQLTDIICAVQGYESPSVLGTSVQETMQQVYELIQSQVVLYNSGNPNGAVAGMTYQFCWDTADSLLYICTASGTESTAVWTFTGISFSSLDGDTGTATPSSGAITISGGSTGLTTVGSGHKISLTGILDVTSGGTGTTTSTGTGSVVLSNAPTLTSISFSPSTQGIVGTTTNNNAATGYVGEFISSVILSASSITLTNITNTNLTSISLTAGDWDVWGNVSLHNTNSAMDFGSACVSSVSLTYPDAAFSPVIYSNTYYQFQDIGLPIIPQRFSLSTTTTIYVITYSSFNAGTTTACGGVFARRVR